MHASNLDPHRTKICRNCYSSVSPPKPKAHAPNKQNNTDKKGFSQQNVSPEHLLNCCTIKTNNRPDIHTDHSLATKKACSKTSASEPQTSGVDVLQPPFFQVVRGRGCEVCQLRWINRFWPEHHRKKTTTTPNNLTTILRSHEWRLRLKNFLAENLLADNYHVKFATTFLQGEWYTTPPPTPRFVGHQACLGGEGVCVYVEAPHGRNFIPPPSSIHPPSSIRPSRVFCEEQTCFACSSCSFINPH